MEHLRSSHDFRRMQRGIDVRRVFWLSILLTCPMAVADDAKPLNIRGFVDLDFGFNPNRPRNHENFMAGTGTTGKGANEFNVNLAAIEFVRDAQPVGFHLSVVAGSGTDIVHAGEPAGAGAGRDVYRYLYQASVSYKPTDRLMIEAGVFPSHIGFEAFFSKDNWNYTRSWLGEFSPYYQTGVHAGYKFTDRWSGEIHVLNGWQIIGENNDAKAIGGRIAYNSDRLSASFNTFDGPELPNDDNHWRHFGNLIAAYKVSPKWTLGGSLDRGHQELPGNTAANGLGAGAFSRYAIDDRNAFAARAERFNDPDNGISGFAQKLWEATLTYEYHPSANLILKFEGRHDHSTAPAFSKREGTADSQTLAIVGAVVTF